MKVVFTTQLEIYEATSVDKHCIPLVDARNDSAALFNRVFKIVKPRACLLHSEFNGLL